MASFHGFSLANVVQASHARGDDLCSGTLFFEGVPIARFRERSWGSEEGEGFGIEFEGDRLGFWDEVAARACALPADEARRISQASNYAGLALVAAELFDLERIQGVWRARGERPIAVVNGDGGMVVYLIRYAMSPETFLDSSMKDYEADFGSPKSGAVFDGPESFDVGLRAQPERLEAEFEERA